MEDGQIDPTRRAPVPPDPLYPAPGGEDPAAVAQREHVVALVEELALTEARIAALHAHQVSVLSNLQVHPHVTTTGLDIADELAPRLRWTTFTTDRRLATAARVATCFPLLDEDLRGAEIDHHRLDVVVREGDLLDEDQARVLDAVLTGRLAGLTTAQIRHLARREIAVIDSQAVKERARRVIADRRIAYTALPDGQGLLEVLCPAPAVRAAYDHLHTLAHDTTHPANTTDPYATHPGTGAGATSSGSGEDPAQDGRGIDARRFDVCIESITAPLSTRPGAATGTGPQITIAWPAAVGLDDLPAHLCGHGAVPAELVRHLLRHTGFRKAATHPTTGHVTATDGHLHPPGTLPDPTRDPVGLRTSERTTPSDRTSVAATPDVTVQSATGGLDRVLTDPSAVDGHDAVLSDPPGTGGLRCVLIDPIDVPAEIALAGPGIGWSDELGGYDDGYDVPTVTGPDESDLDAYVDQVLGDLDDAPPPQTGGTAARAQVGGSGPDAPEIVDPATGPRADEFEVTLAITATRSARLVNPHRAHDTTAWTRRAEHRARTALASCPAAADPAHPYRFTAALRRFLVLRSPTCTAPGCRAPAHRCDLDHTTAHTDGGPTCTCNAGPLCRHHHTAKHATWTVTRTHDDPDDPSLTWLSPLGYLYTVPPTPLLPPVPAVITTHLADRQAAAVALERHLAQPRTGVREEATRRHVVDHEGDRDCRACDPDRPPVLHRPQRSPVGEDRPGGAGGLRGGGDPQESGRPGDREGQPFAPPERRTRPPAGPDDDPPF